MTVAGKKAQNLPWHEEWRIDCAEWTMPWLAVIPEYSPALGWHHIARVVVGSGAYQEWIEAESNGASSSVVEQKHLTIHRATQHHHLTRRHRRADITYNLRRSARGAPQ